MSNQLGGSSSPYLRQHADNPVHWREWSEDALAEAGRRDVPVLLSVGYAACHWCHVMAHESFEDVATAEQMNRDFVCIKVDREERPDIDAIYMNATVAMTGQGGWPMTCFLTASGEPFYCGTYYPPEPRGQQPSFRQLMAAITEAWTQRRTEIEAVGVSVRAHLRAHSEPLPTGAIAVDARLLDHAVQAILADEDRVAGGFGGAPKFPPSALLEGLLRHSERTGIPDAGEAAWRTCAAMARGGIYDQLGGGFSRYAVDNDWQIPHFEKMLYDNAQLLRVYAHCARRTGDPLAIRVTEEIVEFLERDLYVDGAFASSLDADAAGVEGSTYVWTPAQLVEVLGVADGNWAVKLFGVTASGTFEHGTSTLQLPANPADADPADTQRFTRVRAALLAARARRPQPARDDKIVTGWNALAVTALVEAGTGLGRPEWIDLAVGVTEVLLERHLIGDVLHRSSLAGQVGEPLAALEDHAALCVALLSLHQATGDQRWYARAARLLAGIQSSFADEQAPGSWYDAPAGGGLITRPRDPVDGATPAGTSLLAEALLMAGALAESDSATGYWSALAETLERGAVLLAKAPRSAGHWLSVAQAWVAGPIQIAVAESAHSPHDLAATASRMAPGGAIVVAGAQDSLPLLAGRGPVGQDDAVYVCRGSVCSLPITAADDLAAELSAR